jgi:N-acetylmuramoyl-L-alanine amidase
MRLTCAIVYIPAEGRLHALSAAYTWLPLSIFALALIAFPVRLDAAAITGASFERQGSVTELRFNVIGSGLGWHLTTHGQQLWILLAHVRMELPHPMLSEIAAPVTSVETIAAADGTARITVEVSGRIDYAVALLPHEMVLRLAPAGAVANLAAPFVIRSPRRDRSMPFQTAQAKPLEATTTADEIAPGQRSYSSSRVLSDDADRRPADTSTTAVAPAEAAEPSSARNAAPAAYRYDRAPVPIINPPAVEPSGTDRAETPLVVIDPGHGGCDPGTAAADGTTEKEVALAIALRLAAVLETEGIRAELTRDTDTFLSLAERTATANRAGADLFVSIHLNSSPDIDVSGIETYYLNNTSDRATIRLARMENGSAGGYSLSGSPNLNYILSDMRQQYKANDAAFLAQQIERDTSGEVSSSLGIELKPLGAMAGPFYVLVGAMMPAVLVECGFLSNPDETRLLETPAYQQAIANGIARAVGDYFKAGAAVGNL